MSAAGSPVIPDNEGGMQTQPPKKIVRGSHRVMAASGRVPNRLVFGRRMLSTSGGANESASVRFSPLLAPCGNITPMKIFKFCSVPLK